MKAAFLFFCGIHFVSHIIFGQEPKSVATTAEAVAVASAVAYQTALARADVAIAKSLLNERILKGEVGESIRDQTVARYLHKSGKWLHVSPRLGPQGLDHISVQLDESGRPHRLMVDETKFGSSKLLTTQSGKIQMGDEYISERLSGLAKRFDTIRTQGEIASAKLPVGLSSKRVIRVPLSDSESVVFWRPAAGAGSWLYDGPPDSLAKANVQLQRMADLLRAAAEGRVDFPRRVFQVRIAGDVLKVDILDATQVDAAEGNLSKLPVKAKIEMTIERNSWSSGAIKRKIANQIRKQLPQLGRDEASLLARGIYSEAKTAEDALLTKSSGRFTTLQGARAGIAGVVIALPIEILVQISERGAVDWPRVAGMAGTLGTSAGAGSTVGNATTYALVRSKFGHSASTAAAEICGLRSTSRFANLAGGSIGGGAAAILFAYGGYWLDYHDLQTANRSVAAGVTGVGARAAASAVTLGLVSTYGTAGTGVAISSLSGASATSASLAWLGGGSLASKGFGVLGGKILLSTGVNAVVIGTAIGVIYGFHLYDEHQDNIRLAKTTEYLLKRKMFFIQDSSAPR